MTPKRKRTTELIIEEVTKLDDSGLFLTEIQCKLQILVWCLISEISL